MDRDTLKAYDTRAADYAKDWHDQPAPADLHAIVRRFFRSGATADIGCGSGREVGWLNTNGFPAIGFDGSPGLLAEAKRRYPDAEFRLAALPELDGIAAGSFDNVLCETVIMHLPRAAIAPSARRLIEIVKSGGILYLSWRVEKTDRRDDNGRLYTAFDNNLVLDELRDATVVLDEDIVSASSGRVIHRLVARKT
jgi:SAM-dependent methyltransferase